MFYSFDIENDAAEGEAVITKTTLGLCSGIIHKVDIVFPSGCQALVVVAIDDASHQLWPTNVGSVFQADGETISWREFIPMLTEPFELYARTLNADDLYAHTITIRIGILPVSVIAPWLMSYQDRVNAALGVL